jgi:hypothetical protein
MDAFVHRSRGLTYAVIDDLHSEQELAAINKEILDLHRFSLGAKHTEAATDKNGNSLKTSKGVFLDFLYADRGCSAILQANKKLFFAPFVEALSEQDVFFYHILKSTRDTTLLNYYADGEQYLAHRDDAIITCVSFFSVGEFSGGDLVFDAHDARVEFKPNRCVLFPGCALHSAAPIKAEPGNFRVTVATFINYKH